MTHASVHTLPPTFWMTATALLSLPVVTAPVVLTDDDDKPSFKAAAAAWLRSSLFAPSPSSSPPLPKRRRLNRQERRRWRRSRATVPGAAFFFNDSASVPPVLKISVPDGPTATWTCVGLGELECPGVDELPRDSGCQVQCKGGASSRDAKGRRCPSGRAACAKLQQCVRVNTNSEGTWATLKSLKLVGSGQPSVPLRQLPWCAPIVEPKRRGYACTADHALCILLAASVTHDPFSARPIESMPAEVPVLSAKLRDYPRRRHAAVVLLSYLYDEYDALPRALAMLIDHGDEHLSAGIDVYVVPNVFHVHAVYLRYICAFYNDLPKLSVFLHGHHTSWHNTRSSPAAEKLRQMDLRAAAAKGDVYRSFNDFQECWRDGHGEWEAEMLAQRHGWAREMVGALGQPPRLKEAYCCTQFIVSADRIRRRPLSFWRQLLADLLDGEVPPVCKVSGHVLELTWGYMLGEPPDAMCRTDGWGHAGAPGEPTPQWQRLGDATQKPPNDVPDKFRPRGLSV
ncbi:hypothetical protein Ctob_006557 [Chrysochromulina tobinii]|uniref:Uncharacterized protein n=1 Tax=Chrysochromulina tobinii TaxID=1460289 RepID=A0A0M0JED0_9EUKA|nr:hypothetical protein Ctob_006557 [Chrysochromulina tobinii]|eukprot:KOO24810.1 hypothetical protein Ctob_006557 [Chrysochromulina sp. CCMP291]